MRSWQGSLVVTDIKGELSAYYTELFEDGVIKRPYIVFDPMQTDGIGYDPFWWLIEDGEANLVNNIMEIVIAINPLLKGDNQPFWVETEQGILAAALLYYFKLGLSFSEAMTEILASTVSDLVDKIVDRGGVVEKFFLGELSKMKPETLANFDRGLRNKIMLFGIDPYISNAFRGLREGAKCFNWGDMDDCNIFLKIPGEKIEQWGRGINLMLTQLIRHLERRPDKYSPEGENNVQALLLLDEFARFGKLEMITNAISTLRSKCVNICLVIQSIAQIDNIYGEYERRIIFDNCQYTAILRANDAETQQYLSNLIGTIKVPTKSMAVNLNDFNEIVGHSAQIGETREPLIFSNELASLEDILLLTPKGFCRVEKMQLQNSFPPPHRVSLVQRKSFVMDEPPEEPKLVPIFTKAVSSDNDFSKSKYPPVIAECVT